jgi:hypothetical protein
MWMIAVGIVRTMIGIGMVRTMIGIGIVRTMIAVVTAVVCASIHPAVDAGDAERREGSPNSSLGGVKRHA